MEERAIGPVLLLEGEKQDLLDAANTLERHGYRCLVAPLGRAGIEHAERVQPSAIVLDARAGRPGALDTCHALGACAATREIPVLLVVDPDAVADGAATCRVADVDDLTTSAGLSELVPWIKARVEISCLRHALARAEAQLAREVAERERAEKAVEEQQRFLQTAIDALPYPFYLVDASDYSVRLANRAFGAHGPSTTCHAATHHSPSPCGGSAHPCPIEEIKRTRQPVVLEHVHYGKQGDAKYVQIHAYPTFDQGGRLAQIVEYARDITEQRRVEQALRERVKELNCLYGISRLADRSDASLHELLHGIVELLPPAWQFPEVTCARLCLDGQEFRTRNFQQTVWAQTAEIQVSGVQAGRIEVYYLDSRPPAEEGPFLKEERDLLDAIAEEVGRIAERSRSEAERKNAEAILKLRLRLVELADTHSLDALMQHALDELGDLTGSPIGFYHFVEPDQKTLSLQAWSTRTLEEFCQADATGEHYSLDQAGVWVDCVHQRAPVIHNDYATLPHRKGLPPGHADVQRELVVPIIRDGRIVSILGVGNKPVDYDQADVELVEFVADLISSVVERKRAEEQLHAYRLQLEDQNQELDAFAHTVAHDLKNPVTAVIGFADTLLEDKSTYTPEAVDGLDCILQAGLKIDAIIDALMLLSGIRKDEVLPAAVDMVPIVQEAIASLHMLIQRQGARITLIDPDRWPAAVGYAPWIEQIWVNYVSNAIKYGGQPPHVEIGAGVAPDRSTGGPAQARFWVRDNGRGLVPHEQARLFTPFTRLGQVRIEGHGMGLSIVHRIAEKLGGEVGVESNGIPGEGSTFYFTLPLAPEPGP